MSKRATVGTLFLSVVVLSLISGCGESGPGRGQLGFPQCRLPPPPTWRRVAPRGDAQEHYRGYQARPRVGPAQAGLNVFIQGRAVPVTADLVLLIPLLPSDRGSSPNMNSSLRDERPSRARPADSR